MKYLLDTHIFIWLLEKPENLSSNQKKIIINQETELFISPATIWEMAIKVRIGKLNLSASFKSLIEKERRKAKIKILPTSLSHYQLISTLNTLNNHQDPFDHLIIAQSIVENIPVITQDSKFPDYIPQGLVIVA